MRIYAIRNSGVSAYAAQLKTRPSNMRREIPQETLQTDTVSFKRGALIKGAGWGAAIGLGVMGAISALSGGLAAPVAYGLYAAAFGTAGAMTGKTFEDSEDD